MKKHPPHSLHSLQCGWHWIPRCTKHSLLAVLSFSHWDSELLQSTAGKAGTGQDGTSAWRELYETERRIHHSQKVSPCSGRKGQMGCCICLHWQPHFAFTSQHPAPFKTFSSLSLSFHFFPVHFSKINSMSSITSGDTSSSFNIQNRQTHAFPVLFKHRENSLHPGRWLSYCCWKYTF